MNMQSHRVKITFVHIIISSYRVFICLYFVKVTIICVIASVNYIYVGILLGKMLKLSSTDQGSGNLKLCLI